METTSPTKTPGTEIVALRWVSIVLAALLVVTALMIGQGIFNGTSRLITDHGYLGNLIFLLGAIQLGLTFFAWQKDQLGRGQLLLSAVILIALFAQIGLGYMGHRSGMKDATVVHIGLGVLSMGLVSVNAVLFWLLPRFQAPRA